MNKSGCTLAVRVSVLYMVPTPHLPAKLRSYDVVRCAPGGKDDKMAGAVDVKMLERIEMG